MESQPTTNVALRTISLEDLLPPEYRDRPRNTFAGRDWGAAARQATGLAQLDLEENVLIVLRLPRQTFLCHNFLAPFLADSIRILLSGAATKAEVENAFFSRFSLLGDDQSVAAAEQQIRLLIEDLITRRELSGLFGQAEGPSP